jgi:hypothetical protein
MVAALDSHVLLPLSVSDTRPGLRFNRLPMSAWERLGSASFIALICSLSESVIGAEVLTARWPDGRRPISSASEFNSSQPSCCANWRRRFATSGSLIASSPLTKRFGSRDMAQLCRAPMVSSRTDFDILHSSVARAEYLLQFKLTLRIVQALPRFTRHLRPPLHEAARRPGAAA